MVARLCVASICAVAAVVMGGCSDSVPECGNADVKALVIEVLQERYLYRDRFDPGSDFEAKAVSLRDEDLSIVNVITKRRATDDVPERLCAAAFQYSYWEVYANPAKFGPVTAANQDAYDDFKADANNLERGKRRNGATDIAYSVSVTDDGRISVNVSL